MRPEYLGLFSNIGPVNVSVRFSSASDKHRSIAEQSMHWSEFKRLINPETSELYTNMTLDAYTCRVKRYEIEPALNRLTIVIAETDLP